MTGTIAGTPCAGSITPESSKKERRTGLRERATNDRTMPGPGFDQHPVPGGEAVPRAALTHR